MCADIREQVRLLERGLAQKESRYIHRAVRALQKLRKQLNNHVLWNVVAMHYPVGGCGYGCGFMYIFIYAGSLRESLIQFIDEVVREALFAQTLFIHLL